MMTQILSSAIRLANVLLVHPGVLVLQRWQSVLAVLKGIFLFMVSDQCEIRGITLV